MCTVHCRITRYHHISHYSFSSQDLGFLLAAILGFFLEPEYTNVDKGGDAWLKGGAEEVEQHTVNQGNTAYSKVIQLSTDK